MHRYVEVTVTGVPGAGTSLAVATLEDLSGMDAAKKGGNCDAAANPPTGFDCAVNLTSGDDGMRFAWTLPTSVGGACGGGKAASGEEGMGATFCFFIESVLGVLGPMVFLSPPTNDGLFS